MRHTTLDGLIAQVMAEDARSVDMLADTRRMSVTVDSHVIVDVDSEGTEDIATLDLSEHAMGQMATDLGIPKRYYDRMRTDAPELLVKNAHHWMYQEPKRRMLRAYTREGGNLIGRAWLSDRYRRLDNIEIAKKLLPEFDRLDAEVTFHNASITDERFYLRAVFPRMTKDVKVGDTVQWGVQIRNSEVGAATFDISSYINRLICVNGMVVAKILNARHIGKRISDILSDEAVQADDHAFWLAARDTLRASLDEAAFEEAVTTLRETTEGETITSPIAATKRLGKTLSLSDEETEAVLLNLSQGGDMTRWGMLNAVTATAQSAENFDRGVELEEMGWDIANLSRRDWERIAVAA